MKLVNMEDEIPKYKKLTQSNVSKSRKKSRHKHQYAECLLQYEFPYRGRNILMTSLASYCTVCGKIGYQFKEDKSIVKNRCHTEDMNGHYCITSISGEELYEKYHDRLPVFKVETIHTQYVPIVLTGDQTL